MDEERAEYKTLLRKYIAHVAKYEGDGLNFLESGYEYGTFTPEEWACLKALAEEKE